MGVNTDVVLRFVGKDDTQGAFRSVDKSLTATITKGSAIGSMLGGLATRGVSAAASGIAGMVKTGLAGASAYEQSNQAFTKMLGSAAAAKTFLDDLRVAAAATPFELPDLIEGSKRLMAFGWNAKEAKDILLVAGDAAAGMGSGAEGIDRITRALGQMRAKGKVSGEEMMQLAEMGIPAWQYLADAMGKSIPEVQKMSEKGLIPATKAVKAITDGLRDGTKNAQGFGGMMDKQSQTLEGRMSTLKDTIGNALTDLFLPMLPAINTVIISLTEKLGTIGPKINEFMAKAAPTIAAVSKFFAESLLPAVQRVAEVVVTQLVPAFVKMLPVLAGVVTWVKNNATWLVKVAAGLALVTVAVKGGTAAYRAGTAVLHAYRAAKQTMVLWTYSSRLAHLKSTAAIVAHKMATIAHTAVEKSAAVATRLWAGAQALAHGALNVGKLIAHKAALAAHTAAAALARGAALAWAGAQALAHGAMNLAKLAAHTAAVVASTVAQKAIAVATKAWAAAQWLINVAMSMNPIGLVIAAIAALVAAIVIVWRKSEGFREVVRAVWEGIKVAFSAGVAWVKRVLQAGWDILKKIFSWSPMGIIVTNFDKIIGWFKGLPGKIGAALTTIKDVFLGPFKAAFNAVARAWNNGPGKLSFKTPGWMGPFGGKGFDMPDMPILDSGGIVRGPTLAMLAMNNRPELIVPLDDVRTMPKPRPIPSAARPQPELHIHLPEGPYLGDKRAVSAWVVDALNTAAARGYRPKIA